jgi:hypothetical protein
MDYGLWIMGLLHYSILYYTVA